MTSPVSSVEDVVNLALVRIGYKMRVDNIFEGSVAARAALNVYSQTRDALLREGDWAFAQNISPAVLTGGVAPASWSFEYVYPVDCLRVRNVFDANFIADKNNPLPFHFEIGQTTSAGRVIWSTYPISTLVYTKQVTDPAQWEPLFVEALAIQMAKRLSLELNMPDGAKMAMEDEKTAIPMAEGTIG